MAQAGLPDLQLSYVGGVCRFSTLLQEVFLGVLHFSPLLKNQYDLISVDLIPSAKK